MPSWCDRRVNLAQVMLPFGTRNPPYALNARIVQRGTRLDGHTNSCFQGDQTAGNFEMNPSFSIFILLARRLPSWSVKPTRYGDGSGKALRRLRSVNRKQGDFHVSEKRGPAVGAIPWVARIVENAGLTSPQIYLPRPFGPCAINGIVMIQSFL